jgi:DNA-binding transcriptional MocR family regulator
MVEFPGRPAYLQIADDLRDLILSGALAAGEKLPSQSDLMRDYDMSRTVAKMAINVLLPAPRRRRATIRLRRQGRRPSRPMGAPQPRGTRLRNDRRTTRHRTQGPVMVTDYRFFADDEPTQLSIS